MKNWNSVATSFKYLGVGLQLAVTILFGSFAGYYFDRKMHTTPLWTLVGSAIGLGVGFYQLILYLKGNGKSDPS